VVLESHESRQSCGREAMIIEKKLASFEQSNEVGSSFFAALVISIELHNKEQRVNPFQPNPEAPTTN
jgi:hypothetical protein